MKFKIKKAQGMSINTVIIAAIALIVLVVLVAIFTGRIGMFSKGIGETSANCQELCIARGYPNGGSWVSGISLPESNTEKLPGIKGPTNEECYCKK